jgi:hypothetical protein
MTANVLEGGARRRARDFGEGRLTELETPGRELELRVGSAAPYLGRCTAPIADAVMRAHRRISSGTAPNSRPGDP